MKIEYIKKIDRYLGWVICFISHFHYCIAKLFKEMDKTPPKKVLLVKFFGMGSIILAQPMVMAVRKNFPLAKVYFLTFSSNKDILELFGNVDEILHVELKPLWKFFVDTLKMILYLRKQRIDIAFDLEFFSRYTSIVTYLSGAKQRVEFYSEILWRGDLYTLGVRFNSYFHVRDNFMNLVKGRDLDINTSKVVGLNILPKVLERAVEILGEHDVRQSDKKVCIDVNAGELAIERRWPTEHFVALINKLSFYPVKYLMIGAKYDIPYVNSIISRLNSQDNIINLAGKTSIMELAGIFHVSSLLITNDSGPLHLADAIGIPIVSFFGPETPVLYGPRNSENLIFYKGLICSPCLSVLNAKTVTCTNNAKCMYDINPDDVYKAIVDKYPQIFRLRNGCLNEDFAH